MFSDISGFFNLPYSLKSTFIKIIVSFPSLIPCPILPKELRENSERTPKELRINSAPQKSTFLKNYSAICLNHGDLLPFHPRL